MYIAGIQNTLGILHCLAFSYAQSNVEDPVNLDINMAKITQSLLNKNFKNSEFSLNGRNMEFRLYYIHNIFQMFDNFAQFIWFPVTLTISRQQSSCVCGGKRQPSRKFSFPYKSGVRNFQTNLRSTWDFPRERVEFVLSGKSFICKNFLHFKLSQYLKVNVFVFHNSFEKETGCKFSNIMDMENIRDLQYYINIL